MRPRKALAASLAVAGLLAVVTLNNSSWLGPRVDGRPLLLAHRGIAQRFSTEGLTNETCTAERMLPPTHAFLENTIPSIRAGLDAGADIIEIDVHPTSDGKFVVFHDWTVDCRTEAKGITREKTLAELQKLDIGYGYTADGGRSFPFRGKGVGMMPSLDEVLAAFPEQRLLINVKSRDPAEGEKLAAVLGALPMERRRLLMVYGADEPLAAIRRQFPEVRTTSRAALKSCLLRYIAVGWTGIVPDSCRSMLVLVPINAAPWLWGWPDRMLARMKSVGSEVFVVGPYHGEAFSSGLDTAEDITRLPPGYAGGVWTNEIELAAEKLGAGRP